MPRKGSARHHTSQSRIPSAAIGDEERRQARCLMDRMTPRKILGALAVLLVFAAGRSAAASDQVFFPAIDDVNQPDRRANQCGNGSPRYLRLVSHRAGDFNRYREPVCRGPAGASHRRSRRHLRDRPAHEDGVLLAGQPGRPKGRRSDLGPGPDFNNRLVAEINNEPSSVGLVVYVERGDVRGELRRVRRHVAERAGAGRRHAGTARQRPAGDLFVDAVVPAPGRDNVLPPPPTPAPPPSPPAGGSTVPAVLGRATDFDGDGRADAAVFRIPPGSPQAYWWISLSGGGSKTIAWGAEGDVAQWGAGSLGDVPLLADFDAEAILLGPGAANPRHSVPQCASGYERTISSDCQQGPFRQRERLESDLAPRADIGASIRPNRSKY